MLTKEENELLCRVEGDAAMGQLMRRSWIPACMLEEVAQPDGDPLRIRLLGEDLVAFRDTEGRLGILGEHCSHRRVSLAYGRNEDSGLRCLYHGWKMDVEGNILEMPSEPVESGMCQKIKHKAYPVREASGLAWVYMGPPELMPEFEPPAFASGGNPKVSIAKVRIACNWAQAIEGGIDSAHSSTLHADEIRPASVITTTAQHQTRPSTDKAPRYQVQTTDYGMRYVALRRPIRNAQSDEYARVTVYIAPFTLKIPPNGIWSVIQFATPIDDTHTMFYFIAWADDTTAGNGIDQESWRKFVGCQVGIDVDEEYRTLRNADNKYMQDRQSMRLGRFSGVSGISNQDIVMWETMGPITDRSEDRLGASDTAIVHFRRMMVDAVLAFKANEPAIGATTRRTPFALINSFEGVVSKKIDWRTLGVVSDENKEQPVNER